jgi:hypothetical protein
VLLRIKGVNHIINANGWTSRIELQEDLDEQEVE